MIKRAAALIVAIFAMAAAAGVVVVSAAFALFALVRTYIGPSGAAACVCLAAAILIAVIAVFALRVARGVKPAIKATSAGPATLPDQVMELVRDKPVIAAGAAAAAGLLAWRNPVLVSTILRLLDTRPAPTRK